MDLSNGLLGLGGFGGFSPKPAQNGLLAQYMDPEAMQKAQMKRAMLQAGIGMLQGSQQGGFGNSLAQGLAGGLQGYQGAQDDFMKNAQMQYGFDQQARHDARANTEYDWKLEERARLEEQRKHMEEVIGTLPPELQGFAKADPDGFMSEYTKRKAFPEAQDAPNMETLYDEVTGQQYKAQWNPQTQKWDRVGGLKPSEGGITITNPDGTTTQIGGSGGAKTTEADRRAHLLAQQIVGQEKDLLSNFDSLASMQNSIGSVAPGGRAVMSGEGQLAEDAMKNVVANWLYLTSGATAPPEEVNRQFQIIKPTAFDKAEVVAAKKARLQMIIDTMKVRGNIPAAQEGAQNGQPTQTDGGAVPDVSQMTDEQLRAILNGQ